MPYNLIKSKIDEFNTVAGNLSAYPDRGKLLRQIDIIQEELIETLSAALHDDETELVDGVADLVVTVMGLFSMSEARGNDQVGATLAICDQNLEKFPKAPNEPLVEATVAKYEAEGITLSVIEEHGRYIFKNSETGKVLKPEGFAKIDLTGYVARI